MTIELYNGDCLELMKNIPDGKIDLLLADLPYGLVRCHWDVVIPFEPMWAEFKRIIKPNGAIVLNCQQPFTSMLIMSNLEMFRYCWTWNKSMVTGHLNAHKQPLRTTEDIAVFYSQQCKYNPQFEAGKAYKSTDGNATSNYGKQVAKTVQHEGIRFPKNLINIPNVTTKIHPTEKSIELGMYLISTYTDEGDIILDPTTGSCSYGIAAKRLNRNFIGMELDEKIFSCAKKRIEEEETIEIKTPAGQKVSKLL